MSDDIFGEGSDDPFGITVAKPKPAAAPAPAAAAAPAKKTAADLFGSDDDLFGGGSGFSSALKPTATAQPAATSKAASSATRDLFDAFADDPFA